jgi:hypothetical protein
MMNSTARWIIGVLLALVIILFIALARGGEQRGAETTTTIMT